jgi:hypothetical protein
MVANTVEELYLYMVPSLKFSEQNKKPFALHHGCNNTPRTCLEERVLASFFFGIGIIGNYILDNLGFDYGSRYF